MLHLTRALVALSMIFFLAACGGKSSSSNFAPNPPPAACADQQDNDGDNLIDFPFDPGCSSASDNNETNPVAAACADGQDNDGDNLIDFPNDPGCSSASDNDETDPVAAACADGQDNDADNLIDFPNDPGCSSASDNDETDAVVATACSDGQDNDGDTLIDFPADPGCSSASDNDEMDPPPAAQCADGLDNDQDGKTDLADPGCDDASDNDETDAVVVAQCADGIDNDEDGQIDLADAGCDSAADNDEDNRLSRYDMSNACWAIKDNASGQYLAANGGGYSASAADLGGAEPFYLKPTALGKYMIYSASRVLLSAVGDGNLANVASAAASDNAEWTVLAVDDDTDYPQTPINNVEPSAEQVAQWHDFQDPLVRSDDFTIGSDATGSELVVDGGALKTAANAEGNNDSFSFEAASGCANFPEAQSNFVGEPFKGTQPDGSVLGHADAHVHISATEFLGGGHWGHPFHKFGVEHALGNCSEAHGDAGFGDVIGGLFVQDTDGHATDGYPTFTDWPARGNLTHEAIYWKWIERAWAGGLRVIVNDLVDNETLCELQRNVNGDLTRDCNSMNNAGRQAGTMYAMADYIDAQYGGPDKGFFQIVHSSDEARAVIEDGKIAVVLGIEISNLFDCKVKYNPARQLGPEEEPSDNSNPMENSYDCTTVEGQPNSILTHMQRIHDWGVRQVISIHEFDNAFGGNGIFDGLILNLGNRENSGGIPSGDLAGLALLFQGQPNQAQFEALAANIPTTELATGEWWTTYDCPIEGETEGFSGYLWGNAGGATQGYLPQPACIPMGQGGRSGGPTPCYPADARQCNARWMTPAGLYTYGKMMEMGFLFDWDHMEVGMKTQALELAEAQTPAYPFVSTHGTFGGTTMDQATRMMANGGFLYPSNGSSGGFRNDMDETLGVYNTAMVQRKAKGLEPLLFGFGYGTDTNGLSAQSGPRNNPERPINYPFTLFDGEPFTSLTGFADVQPISFLQPTSSNVDGEVTRTWHEDVDGNAHYGMLADFVKEVVIDSSTPEQHTQHLFNSAEAYLRTWALTEASSVAIQGRGGVIDPGGILRPSPPEGDFAP